MSVFPCTVCRQPADIREQITLQLDGLVMHKDCLRCSSCKIPLNRSNFFKINDMLFCETHFTAYQQQRGQSGTASSSQILREQGNQKLAQYRSTRAPAFLGEARGLYQEAVKAAENNDDKASALNNLCLIMRDTSFTFLGQKQMEAGCAAAREALRLAEEAFEAGKAVKPEAWVLKLRKSSVEFAKDIAAIHTDVLQQICPSHPTCFSEAIPQAAADRLFKTAVARMDERQAQNQSATIVAKREGDEHEAHVESWFNAFDICTENFLEDAHRFAILSQHCLVKEELLSSGIKEKMDTDISLRGANILELMNDILTHKTICEARRALHRACILKREAIKKQEDLQMDLVYLALDEFKLTATLAESKDIETEASALAESAEIYHKILKIEQVARGYAKRSIELAHALAPRNVTTSAWCKLATMILRDYQLKYTLMEAAEKRALRQKYMVDITAVREALEPLKDNPAELLKKVYATYRPYSGRLDHSKLGPTDMRKTFISAVAHYHPDSQLGADEKGFIVFYEIHEIMSAVFGQNWKC